jgi:hypothetical protein
MYSIEQERAHPVPPPPPLSMEHIPAYPVNQAAMSGMPRSPHMPQSISTVFEGRIYSLDVVQQPIRARMCGFGDKVGFGWPNRCPSLCHAA